MTLIRPLRLVGNNAFVTLTRGYEAVIDRRDISLVDGRNWSVLISGRRKAKYACRVVVTDVGQKMILLHRVIIGAQQGQEVDHIDGDGLNNQRSNLRICTRSENTRNTGRRADNKSGFKGVFFETRAGRWRSEIRTNGKARYLGYFDSPEEAHQAYVAAAAEDHGSFARSV